jgi:hypothetical protein
MELLAVRADSEAAHMADKTNKLDREGVHICPTGWYRNPLFSM